MIGCKKYVSHFAGEAGGGFSAGVIQGIALRLLLPGVFLRLFLVGVGAGDFCGPVDEPGFPLVIQAEEIGFAAYVLLLYDIVEMRFIPALPAPVLPFAGGIDLGQADPAELPVREPAEPRLPGLFPQLQLYDQKLPVVTYLCIEQDGKE